MLGLLALLGLLEKMLGFSTLLMGDIAKVQGLAPIQDLETQRLYRLVGLPSWQSMAGLSANDNAYQNLGFFQAGSLAW